MKLPFFLAAVTAGFLATAQATEPASLKLPHRVDLTPEFAMTFQDETAIQIKEITGTAPHFQVGGVYRIKGVCQPQMLDQALLYIGYTADAGPATTVQLAGASVTHELANGMIQFECTFLLFRPGLLQGPIVAQAR